MQYDIRARSFGEIMDTGFRLVRNHFALLVGIASIIHVPIAIFGAWLSTFTRPADQPIVGVAFLAYALFIMLMQPIVSSAITVALGDLYLGRPATFGKALRTAFSIVVPLVGTSLLAYLCILGGLILLVVPGIYLMMSFLLLGQITVLERRFGTSALRRSRDLMRGNLWRGLGIVIVGSVLAKVLGGALGFALGFIPLLGAIGSGLAQAAGAAFTSAVLVVLYFDIRCRKEAFDVERLSQLVQERAAPESVTPAPVAGA